MPDFGSNPANSAPAAAAKPSPQVPSATASAPTPDGSNGVAAAGAPATGDGTDAAGKGDHGSGVTAGGGGGPVAVGDATEAGGLSGEDGTKDGSKAGEKESFDGDGNGVVGHVDKAADTVVVADGESASPKENGSSSAPAAVSGSNKRPREEANERVDAPGENGDGGGGVSNAGRGRNERLQPKAAIRAAEAVAAKGGALKPPTKLVCAQPFPLMRGHTAFLTFATTPVARELGTAVAAAAEEETAVSAEEAKGGSVDGQSASVGGGLEGTSNPAGAGDGGGGGSDGGSGAGRGGGEMDVCKEEAVAGEGKGKGREVEKPSDCAQGRAAAAVSSKVDPSSVADR